MEIIKLAFVSFNGHDVYDWLGRIAVALQSEIGLLVLNGEYDTSCRCRIAMEEELW
jgi:hypothetical protein